MRLAITLFLLLWGSLALGQTCVNQGGGTATLSWTPPTTNEDGTVLDNLAGYKIYMGCTQSGVYEDMLTLNNPGLSSFVVEFLKYDVVVYFTVTAFNTDGNESVMSNEASKLMPPAPPPPPPPPKVPNPPTNLTVE